MIDARVQKMIDDYVDGTLDADGHRDLIQRVNNDAAVASAFVRATFDDRRVRDELIGRRASGPMPMPTRAASTGSFRIAAYAAAALVAAVVVAVYLYVATTDLSAPDTVSPDAPLVATVIDATGDLMIGDRLAIAGHEYPARPVSLASGSAEFQLFSGANVRIAGPVELDLRDAMHSTLHRGVAAFSCPSTAHGYTVDLPGGAQIIDLGTRFDACVDEDGLTRVAVHEGAVLVRASDGAECGLVEGQAVALDADGLLVDEPIVDVFGASRFVRWTFDEAEGFDLQDTGRGFGADYPARIAWGTPGVEGPDRVVGRSGRSLSFDGKNDYVETGVAGIGNDEPRTIGMWVRVPRDGEAIDAYAMLSYGEWTTGGLIQMSWNPDASSGPMGAARVGVLGDSIVARTDLRDGTWHHVAFVYDGRVATLYVDGVVEANQVMKLRTAVGPDAHPVAIGKAVTGSGHSGFFRGHIDDVFITDAALSPEAIARHVASRRDPQPNAQSRNRIEGD